MHNNSNVVVALCSCYEMPKPLSVSVPVSCNYNYRQVAVCNLCAFCNRNRAPVKPFKPVYLCEIYHVPVAAYAIDYQNFISCFPKLYKRSLKGHPNSEVSTTWAPVWLFAAVIVRRNHSEFTLSIISSG